MKNSKQFRNSAHRLLDRWLDGLPEDGLRSLQTFSETNDTLSENDDSKNVEILTCTFTLEHLR